MRQPRRSAARPVGPPCTHERTPPATTAAGAASGSRSWEPSAPSWLPLAAATTAAAASAAAVTRAGLTARLTATATVAGRTRPRRTGYRTDTPSTRVPAPVRPLSPAHWARKYDGRAGGNGAGNEPPLAPAVTTWLVQRPPLASRRETTICSPPCAPASVPVTVIRLPARRRPFVVKRRVLVVSDSRDTWPASPPVAVPNSWRCCGPLAVRAKAGLAPLATTPSAKVRPPESRCGRHVRPPSLVRSTTALPRSAAYRLSVT